MPRSGAAEPGRWQATSFCSRTLRSQIASDGRRPLTNGNSDSLWQLSRRVALSRLPSLWTRRTRLARRGDCVGLRLPLAAHRRQDAAGRQAVLQDERFGQRRLRWAIWFSGRRRACGRPNCRTHFGCALRCDVAALSEERIADLLVCRRRQTMSNPRIRAPPM